MAVLGCGSLNPFSSKPETTKTNTKPANQANQANKEKPLDQQAIDTVVGEEKIGIPECDEVFDELTRETEGSDEGYLVKAARAYFYNKIRESIKKSLEENKNDPAKMARECKQYKVELDKYKAAEEEKKQQ